MSLFKQLMDVYVFGKHRLRSVKLLPLGSTLDAAIDLYGEPTESQLSEHAAEIMTHTFVPSQYHDVHLSVWQDKVQSITYWSAKADPTDDLRCMFEGYKEGNGWQVMTEGYWYQRSDGRVRLWCSAIPAIGVAYTDFLRAKSDFETKHSLSLLDQLEDVTWAPNKAIEELQAQYVRGENRNLLDFARRSDRIAVSPDGSTVFVVRHHRAHGGPEGFGETNQPPEVGGTSTQVINVFSSSKGVQSWGKITLPRDSRVDLIHFEGEECHLIIRQSPTGKVLAWNAPVQTIRRLQGIGILQRPMTDEALWKELEDSQRKGED